MQEQGSQESAGATEVGHVEDHRLQSDYAPDPDEDDLDDLDGASRDVVAGTEKANRCHRLVR